MHRKDLTGNRLLVPPQRSDERRYIDLHMITLANVHCQSSLVPSATSQPTPRGRRLIVKNVLPLYLSSPACLDMWKILCKRIGENASKNHPENPRKLAI